eukprot:5700656-Heterocapsa_arctica.AAC.1
MAPKFDDATFRVEWMKWERQIAEYDQAANRPMEDSMKIAAIVDGAPPTVRQFLRLVPIHIATYNDLRVAIRSFLDRGS